MVAAVVSAGNMPGVVTSADAAAPAVSSWSARSGLPPEAARVLQSQIDLQIAAYGGVQVSPYEISYNGGDPIMVFANPLTGAFPTGADDRAEAGGTAGFASSAAQFGQVVPLTTSYLHGCPYTASSGWACFYENIDFNNFSCAGGASPACTDGGRLLQFQDCGTQSLATYGFSGETTSWVNNTSVYVAVYDSSDNELWSESPGAVSAYVGSAANDKADNFWLIC